MNLWLWLCACIHVHTCMYEFTGQVPQELVAIFPEKLASESLLL